jgi:glycosyltransferase involved in cell wall biosynthesis
VRIAFLTQPWATALPPSESVAIWTEAIATRLAADHDVVIWSRDREGNAAPLQLNGIEYRFVRGRGDFRLERALRPFDRLRPARRPLFASLLYRASYHLDLLRALRADPPDVVHIPTFSQLVRPVRRACPRSLVVLHVRDEMTARLDRGMLRRRLPRADAVVGVSESVSAGLRAACPEARVHTIHNGVDLARFMPPAERDPAGPLRLLYVGRISPEKGTHVLFEAFEALAAREPVELDVLGEEALPPPDMLALLGGPEVGVHGSPGYLARSLGQLSDSARARVRLHGRLPHEELPRFFREADLLVVPSLSEAFGKPIVEAMAAGLPVVATRAGGIPEIVADSQTGLLVPPNDPRALAEAVSRLGADPGLRRTLGTAGRKRAEERFSYDRIAGEVAELYATLGKSQ